MLWHRYAIWARLHAKREIYMFRFWIAAPLLLLLSLLPLRAEVAPLAPPTDAVMLTVTGAIGVTNAEGAAVFDLKMLQDIGVTGFATSTTWTTGVVQFDGVSLKALLDRLGVVSGTLKMYAVNDYAVEVPVSDAVEGGPILAYAQDGKQMSVRDKGPLWLVYPFDLDPEYRTEVIYSRSIWQLVKIEIVP